MGKKNKKKNKRTYSYNNHYDDKIIYVPAIAKPHQVDKIALEVFGSLLISNFKTSLD